MSMNTRRPSQVGKPNLEIDIGEPTYMSPVEPVVVEKTAVPEPQPTFEKKLAEKYPWLIEGKPTHWLLRAVWWLYTRLRLYKFEWIPVPREVLSYATAVEEKKAAINALTAAYNATGQVSVKSFKGGVGKTNISAMLVAGASIASGEDCLLMDVNLDGATALSRFPISPELVGKGMTTPELVAIYEQALSVQVPKNSELVRVAGKLMVRDLESGNTKEAEIDYTQVNTPTLRQLQELPNRPYKDPISKAIVVADDFTSDLLSEVQFEHGMRFGKKLAYLAVADTPPGFNQDATRGVDHQVTVQLRIGRFDQDISLQRVRSMRQENEHETLESKSAAASKQPSRVKLRSRPNTPIVILNATPKRFCNRRTQYKFAERFATVPNHVLPIPFINDLDKMPIDIESYDARTRYHIYDLVLRTFEKLKEFNEYAALKVVSDTSKTT